LFAAIRTKRNLQKWVCEEAWISSWWARSALVEDRCSPWWSW